MGNCLVTKLKGIVDNDNLPVLGQLKFKANYEQMLDGSNESLFLGIAGDNATITFYNASATLEKHGSENTLTNPYTVMSSDGAIQVRPQSVTDDEGVITIDNKYSIVYFKPSFGIFEENLEELMKQLPNLTYLIFQGTVINGDISTLANYDLRLISIAYCTTLSGSVRSMLNSMAALRENGSTMQIAIGSSTSNLTDKPVSVNGTYYKRYTTIYFTSDTVTYPHGWYAKTYNNIYYNANDEEISAPTA